LALSDACGIANVVNPLPVAVEASAFQHFTCHLNALFLLNPKNLKNFSLLKWIKMSQHPTGKSFFSLVKKSDLA
jgi:hypothetical protein